jgi:hypothetical protein
MKPSPYSSIALLLPAVVLYAQTARAIMAGGETALPPDFPSNRLDPLGPASPFNAVGALSISSGGWNYKGSGTAISPNWVLTAGHNLDTNDDGAPDAGLAIDFHLPGFGSFTATAFHTFPGFTGFAQPSVQRDLGLLYFATPLPADLVFPALACDLQLGEEVALVGYGRSGYGSYGYTTSASLTDRRIGYNLVDMFTLDDQGGGFNALFRYDFDAPDTYGQPNGSLGNDVESLIGPGDSGGPLLVNVGGGYALAGVNTFTEGYGGRFGDVGGGVVLEPYLDWITATTGIAVPEPTTGALLLLGVITLVLRSRTAQMRLASDRSRDFQVAPAAG